MDNNIKKARNLTTLTQEDVAQKLGVTIRTYQNYESGKTQPPFDIIDKLCFLFDCSIDFLLGHESKGILHMDSFTKIQQIVIDDLKELDDDLCEKAEAYIKGLLETQKERQKIRNFYKNRI